MIGQLAFDLVQNDDLKIFDSLPEAIKAARNARGIPIQKLANMTGCEVSVIDAIESGHFSVSFLEVQNLLVALVEFLSAKLNPEAVLLPFLSCMPNAVEIATR